MTPLQSERAILFNFEFPLSSVDYSSRHLGPFVWIQRPMCTQDLNSPGLAPTVISGSGR